MPSQRIADAAQIAPYLTHAISHHGQVTLVPPDNAGRIRQAKPKKNRSRTRPDRNVRSEEDMRFNIGPRPFRNPIPTRSGRRPVRPGRQDRGRDEVYDQGGNDTYPDYPPPSFQEAISSTPVSVYPIPTPLVIPPRAIPDPRESQPVLSSGTPSPVQPPRSHPFPQSHSSRNSDVDSDDSLEIVEMDSVRSLMDDDISSGNRLEDGVRRDWISRRGVEFPAPPDDHVRGRTRSRPILDFEPEDVESIPNSPKKRFMSLSPLRTLFPYRPMSVQDRALSAHPSPGSSPYSSRSSFPFLSTTSLKMSISTSSFLKLPLTPSPPIRGESLVSRTLSSLKGKEKAEPLESWEFIPPSPSESSLTGTSAPRLKRSPNRSQSFSYGTPSIDGTRSITPQTEVTTRENDSLHSPASPHPLSLRDRKAPPIPFVSRHVRRPPPPPPAPFPESTSPTSAQANMGPILTTVRTKKTKPPPPPPKKKTQVLAASPLSIDSWRADDESPISPTSILQRALLTPLPPTPIDRVHFEYEPSPTTPTADIHVYSSPTAPILPFSTSSEHNIHERSPFASPSDTPHRTPPPPLPTPIVQTPSTENATSASGRHYPGRPLPRPPGSNRPLVDSTYAGYEDQPPVGGGCPEGLLIDLDDSHPVSGTSTPYTEEGRYPNHLSISGTPSSASSTEFLGSIGTTAPSDLDVSVLSTLVASSSIPMRNQFSEITDLDVLVSRLDGEQRDGSDYDALLLLSDFIGSATPTRTHNPTPILVNPPSPSPSLISHKATHHNVALLGNVGVERRRTTKDGRVKLKLVLLDTPVDRCGICLTQFKDDDMARLGSLCRHAFHEKCLRPWLIRNKTCPMCRELLADPL